MRKHRGHISFHVATLVLVVLFVAGYIIPSSHATSLYTASDLIGQFDATPVYTSSFTAHDANAGQVSTNSVGVDSPTSIIADTTHQRLFVADSGNHRVLIFNTNSDGTPVDDISDAVLGQSDFITGTGGGLTSSTIGDIWGMAYDSTRDLLYVDDTANNRVLIFDTASITNGEPAVHVLGQTNFTSSGFLSDTAGLYPSFAIALDPVSQKLYVAQTILSGFIARVSVFDVNVIIDGESAVNVIGQTDFTSNDFAGTASTFANVWAMTVDSTNQYLYLVSKLENRVLLFDIRASGSAPVDICSNGNTTTGIADGMTASCVLGQSDFTSTTGATSDVGLNAPLSVSYNSTTHILYVGDTNRVVSYDVATLSDGMAAEHVFGQDDLFSLSGSTQSATSINLPLCLGTDQQNNLLFVCDNSDRVIYYDTTSITNHEPAVGVLGQSVPTSYTFSSTPNFTTSSINSGALLINDHGVSGSKRVLIDATFHRLFLADYGNARVLEFDLDANNDLLDHTADHVLGQPDFLTNTQNITQNGLSSPDSLAFNPITNMLYVVDGTRVVVFNVASITDGENAVNVIGQSNFTLNNVGHTSTQVSVLSDVDVDTTHNYLYVSDNFNNRVLLFDIRASGSAPVDICSNGNTTTGIADGMTASCVLGQSDFTSNGSGLSDTALYGPSAVLLGNNNKLFIADSNSRVLVFDVASIVDGESAINVLGQPDFSSNALHLTQDGLLFPQDLGFDSGNSILYVGDDSNGRVLLFDVTTISNGENAIAVLGQDSFTSSANTTPVSDTSITVAYGVTYDIDNSRLYVGDSNNNRILIFDFVRLTTPFITSSAVVGSGYTQALTTTNSQGTVSFEVFSGSLPPGITLNAGTGTLSGAPTTAGSYTFTLRAVDTFGVSTFYSNQKTFSITVAGGGGGGGGGPSWTDYCPNIAGVQDPIPTGMGINGSGDCVTDVCVNISGLQETVPSGMTGDATNTCTPVTPPPATCTDNTATNYGAVGACVYAPPPDTCATNPSLCPVTPATCTDHTATNFGAVGTCVYAPPATCTDNTATNYGAVGACVYAPPPDTCATNPSLCPVVTPPVLTCADLGTCPVVVPPITTSTPPPPFSSLITKIITALGLISGLLGTIFATPFSFSELILLPSRLWSLLLAIFGIKKRARPWGTVYDAITKQPLDPAYVSLFDMSGKEISTSITDLDGRYGFLVPPGVYRLEAKKTNYLFPSKKLANKVEDELYKDLYFGENVTIERDGQVITKNIPMDPEKPDWNEMAKRNQKLMRFYSKYDKILLTISDLFFVVGFIVASAALIFAPEPYNVIIFGLYVLLSIIKETGVNPRKLSRVIDSSGAPLSFAIVRIYRTAISQEVSHKVTTERGQFYCLIPNGSYYLTVERKNLDQTYTKVHQSAPFEVKKGVVKMKIVV